MYPSRSFSPALKYLGPGERDHRVHDAARRTDPLSRGAQNEFFVDRIQCNSRCHVSGELLNRNSPAGWNVSVIVDAPGAYGSVGAAADDPTLLRINLE